jgi:hypothetical protein
MHSVEKVLPSRHSVGSEIVTVLGRERERRSVKTDSNTGKGVEKAKAFSQKACSEAAIPSVATSTQKEKDGIGLHCC